MTWMTSSLELEMTRNHNITKLNEAIPNNCRKGRNEMVLYLWQSTDNRKKNQNKL